MVTSNPARKYYYQIIKILKITQIKNKNKTINRIHSTAVLILTDF